VLLDSDLAALYDVPTKVFQLTWEEAQNLRSQSVTLKRGSNIKYQPYVFTEQGVAMLSSVLRSSRAIAVNIEIMRAFVRLRGLLASNKVLARKLDELAGKVNTHDEAITAILSAIRELMTPPTPEKKRKIGFIQDE